MPVSLMPRFVALHYLRERLSVNPGLTGPVGLAESILRQREMGQEKGGHGRQTNHIYSEEGFKGGLGTGWPGRQVL